MNSRVQNENDDRVRMGPQPTSDINRCIQFESDSVNVYHKQECLVYVDTG